MSNELTSRKALNITSMADLNLVAEMFAKSGMFTDIRDAAQAGVKIMAGAAWGIDPFQAISGIYIVQNRPTVSAGLMASAVKGHPVYDYRVRERSDKACRIEFFERAESLGVSEYTMAMAQRAGLASKDIWKKHPEAMLFARAMSSGVRAYCPDVFGVSTYTPDELGANVDEEGNYIEVQSRPERPAAAALNAPAPEPQPEPEAAPEQPDEPTEAAPVDGGGVTVKQLSALAKVVKKQGLDAAQARAFFGRLFDRAIASAKELTKAEASRVIGWDDDAWQAALYDYAESVNGGPPEEEPA